LLGEVVKFNNVLLLSLAGVFVISGCVPKKEVEIFHELDKNKTIENQIVTYEEVENKSYIYRFKPFDRIAVNVYNYPTYNTPPEGVLIDKRGYANLPIIGRIKVSGLTEEQASSKIQKLMRKEIVDIYAVAENPAKQVYIIGEVNKPGPYKMLRSQTDLLKAIATAGGFRDGANVNVIYILRKKGKEAKLQRLSLSGTLAVQNAYYQIIPGDIIYVMPNSAKKFNMTTGETIKMINSSVSPIGAAKAIIR
jgi:polysaccharide export outer membrane protein